MSVKSSLRHAHSGDPVTGSPWIRSLDQLGRHPRANQTTSPYWFLMGSEHDFVVRPVGSQVDKDADMKIVFTSKYLSARCDDDRIIGHNDYDEGDEPSADMCIYWVKAGMNREDWWYKAWHYWDEARRPVWDAVSRLRLGAAAG